jgi:hypothetical protein
MNAKRAFLWPSLILAVVALEGWFFAFAPQVHADGGVALWTNIYATMGGDDSPIAIAADRNGNVFVTGGSWNGSNSDYATIGYSNAGVPLWTNRYNGPGNGDDISQGIAVDNSGNVSVTGWSSGTNGQEWTTIKYSGTGMTLWTSRYSGPSRLVTPKSHSIAADRNGNVFVESGAYAIVAYSTAGMPLWTNRYVGPIANDTSYAITVDGSGKVFVTGESYPIPDTLTSEYATVAYSAAGAAVWTNFYTINGGGRSIGFAITTDANGNVFVTGSSKGEAGKFEYATVSYSGAGVPLWTNRYSDTGNNAYALAIAVDRSGNVLVTGRSNNGTTDEYVTIKYSNAGLPLWTNRYSGGIGNISDAIAVDSSGNVFVTGTLYNGTNNDYSTIGYSAAGLPLWTNLYPGSDDVFYKPALAVDSSGNVLVTGSSGLHSSGGIYYATVKYSSSVPPPVNLAIVPDGSGGYFIRFSGVPGSVYRLQRATRLDGPWFGSAPQTAPTSGLVEFWDLFPPPSQAFYRTVQP